ncbi:two-component system, OmpR family, alkaline phosphatase synthesis response regulator PhoP [Mucilaginibacter pineti]|uniref:Two-component system, OmpR family, alkaline phosphatase synthesis response regulator PhoP n=1 Tax=Mucilaginibacter pineti TaxID=1391627 RepID=A0A1G7LCK6_9SPHI|nr:response regulator [Mucilaginibacter pineti]SDF47034.1 two-component system, OmpR family, alkaline phosphatase synthesis response regulator PhoP [Mucilaginibacter pineti]
MLGDSDGRDICKILKNAPDTRQIPVIIVSATYGLHTAHEKRCGVDDYISKPFDVNELIDRVRKYAP